MQRLPEFVRDEESEEPVRRAVSANLTGWESVIFQLTEPPDDDPEPVSESACSTAALAP
jgi:hypothetical protein